MMEFTHKIEVHNLSEFLTRYVDVFCAIGVDEKYWPCKAEKEFFVKSVILYNRGMDLMSAEARDELMELFKHTKDSAQSVYQYRLKLRKKGWLIQKNNTLTVPAIFDLRKQQDPNNINFNLHVSHKSG